MIEGSLPAHLAERVHALGPEAPAAGGRYVLYWMRTAVRAHDNPALDAAAEAARALGLPFFVYHALSERYPYASDRHHRFILEGARDVAREMAEWGVGYAFHLEREGHRGPHLLTLAADAALVVTEDMPVAPLSKWTASLARRVPVWVVDTACLAPMRRAPRSATTRAFRFRDATRDARARWLTEPWPDAELSGDPWLPELPFEPLWWVGPHGDRLPSEADDLPALIAACAIDHTVGPVPHTPGGSRAGYARWKAFRADGLTSYARRRNDALADGVSRMSPYLHYGQVSPFRLAREATEAGGKGADKYLDELLVWREMAYAFCAHHPEHGTVDGGLPGWARDTLAAHAGDARRLLSWERMARGRTGDALWDAAQRSLLVHGELHNNVRMTWGKAVLGWTPDAAAALERIVDLNHRYALDGRDPASYGGILWCLGQFDRPFAPERPVFGTVRSRSTDTHARRLDVRAYAARTARPAWAGAPSVAIVGAGPAGLMAARTLHDHGLRVAVFDKGRRPGGRANTREHDAHRFDHGAQYVTVRDPVVDRYLRSWAEEGVVARWDGRLVRVRRGQVEAARDAERWVGTPGMIDLAAHLAREVDVRCGVRITSVKRADGGWRLLDADGERHGPFGRVVVAVPAPQAAPLLEASPALRAAASAVEMAPCWAGMFAFQAPVPLEVEGAPVDGLFLDGPVSWMARDSSKPGRPAGERWVVHMSPAWTFEHWELPRDEVPARILAAVREQLGSVMEGAGGFADPFFQRVHRWGYALADEPAPGGVLEDARAGLYACGDWCAGARLEDALRSGMAAAGRILGRGPEEADPRLAAGPHVAEPTAQRELALG